MLVKLLFDTERSGGSVTCRALSNQKNVEASDMNPEPMMTEASTRYESTENK